MDIFLLPHRNIHCTNILRYIEPTGCYGIIEIILLHTASMTQVRIFKTPAVTFKLRLQFLTRN